MRTELAHEKLTGLCVIDLPTESEPVVVVEGDCLEMLRGLPGGCVDAVITDPPFGTDSPKDGYGRRSLGGPQKRILGDESLTAMGDGLAECFRLLSPNAWAAVFVSPKLHADSATVAKIAGFEIVGEVVWDKAMPGLGGGIRYQHELVLLLAKGTPSGCSSLFSVIRCCRVQTATHPHEKPVSLIRQLVRYVSDEDAVILDPFAGSGTTGVAAALEHRRCILIEKEPAYVALCRKRIAKVMDVGMFAETP